jgi:hypothetical protein
VRHAPYGARRTVVAYECRRGEVASSAGIPHYGGADRAGSGAISRSTTRYRYGTVRHSPSWAQPNPRSVLLRRGLSRFETAARRGVGI